MNFLQEEMHLTTFTLSENATISRNFHESLKIIVLTKNLLFSDEGVQKRWYFFFVNLL